MFGFKIISKSEYMELKQVATRHYEAHKKERAEYEKTKKDCESLREQLNEKIKENFRLKEANEKLVSDFNEELTKLRKGKNYKFDDLFEFHIDLPHCSECKKEQPDCRKWSVGSHMVCVTRKPSFRKGKK